MMRKEEKTQIIEANKRHDGDTGSPEVQIAILTKRINAQPPRPAENGRPPPQPAQLPHADRYRLLSRSD